MDTRALTKTVASGATRLGTARSLARTKVTDAGSSRAPDPVS